jgi:hypothetical protein
MIALTKARPLVDGENEYITIERIVPAFKGRQHLHPDYWTAEGLLDGKLMRLTILHADRPMFLAAGYTPYDIFQNVETAVHIDIVTRKDDANRWRVAEVVASAETAYVHTEAERQAAWVTDLREFGGAFQRVGDCEARFVRLGNWVTWVREAGGEYVRITGGGQTRYAGKVQS